MATTRFIVPGTEPAPGFYWYYQNAVDNAPVVVQVNHKAEVEFCGQEGFFYLPSTGSDEYVISGVFVGPITPPTI